MILFNHGPAHGVMLRLRRAPIFLRVVDNGTNFDALDQRDDEAGENERIYVYRILTEPQTIHIRCRPRSQGGWYVYAEYEYYANQPGEAVRDNKAWKLWCKEEIARNPWKPKAL